MQIKGNNSLSRMVVNDCGVIYNSIKIFVVAVGVFGISKLADHVLKLSMSFNDGMMKHEFSRSMSRQVNKRNL
jgi:hypothetical protein